MKSGKIRFDSGSKIEIRQAETSTELRRGLLGEKVPPPWGMLLRRAPIIHTFSMSFALDLVWIKKNKIAAIKKNVPPGRIAIHPSSLCLELASGSSDKLGLRAGDSVLIELDD